jgi:hypothetical protein
VSEKDIYNYTAMDKTPIGEKNDHFKRKNESQVKNAFIDLIKTIIKLISGEKDS